MPQGRRKVPFSGKKKKEQLINKRKMKTGHFHRRVNESSSEEHSEEEYKEEALHTRPSNERSISNRFALKFHKETKRELLSMKEQAGLPLAMIPPSDREVGTEYFDHCDFPIRPEWHYGMTKEELLRNENRYFREYLEKLERFYREENKPLSVFELNLETWRQLWRVLEISDIILVIVDARYSALLFPPSLYSMIKKDPNKSIVLIMNKVDLVSPEIVVAWKEYFAKHFPELPVVLFASYKICRNEDETCKKRIRMKLATEHTYSIFKECQKIVGSDIDLTKWEQKILEDITTSEEVGASEDGENDDHTILEHRENYEFDFQKRLKYKDGILTIGCVGFPNVGKSSVINALKGRKVVSVSRTPGHTKHFQTIFLTDNVKLCDCPGLVFPSSVPKCIQAILGSYPIAQLRDPYCSVKYIAERINLPKVLNLKMPSDFSEWTAIAICEAFAIKRGFFTTKSRPDLYRAANSILRMTLDGKIILEFFPPNYFKDLEKWKNHSDLEQIRKIQAGSKRNCKSEFPNVVSTDASSQSDIQDVEEESSQSSDGVPVPKSSKNVFELLGDE